ncbi:MAG: nitrilase-related carbon-nitrogen hydrolase [Promethearchaeota archaeon]
MLRLAVGQMEPRINDHHGNLSRMMEILDSASDNDVDVLVLPELVNSGYVFETKQEVEALAEQIPDGPFSSALLQWSARNTLVVAGLAERVEASFYNSAGVFGNRKHLVTYRKIQLFDREKDWFEAGDEEPPVVEFRGHRFGVIVCFDWAFPELTRILALKGAQIVLHPGNFVLPYCPDAMTTRSIENLIFTATAGRTGDERGVSFIGGSQVTTPKGEILFRLKDRETKVAWVDVDLTEADNKAITERNDVLKDRRPELYRRLTETP